ncbi:MAG: hypothetical protein AAB517_01770 [Patescibacteria group bacterium]
MNLKKILTVSVLAAVFVLIGVYARVNVVTSPAGQYQKIDYGANMPVDFPTDIPIGEGVKVEQSYGLNYTGQKQLTIVFLSAKTTEENYAIYVDFLEKQKWNISNKYASSTISSLYGTKGNYDINVTIHEDEQSPSILSQVSISVLKKP